MNIENLAGTTWTDAKLFKLYGQLPRERIEKLIENAEEVDGWIKSEMEEFRVLREEAEDTASELEELNSTLQKLHLKIEEALIYIQDSEDEKLLTLLDEAWEYLEDSNYINVLDEAKSLIQDI